MMELEGSRLGDTNDCTSIVIRPVEGIDDSKNLSLGFIRLINR
jgi:hypothetical protein